MAKARQAEFDQLLAANESVIEAQSRGTTQAAMLSVYQDTAMSIVGASARRRYGSSRNLVGTVGTSPGAPIEDGPCRAEARRRRARSFQQSG
jgi:hypothetical protein